MLLSINLLYILSISSSDKSLTMSIITQDQKEAEGFSECIKSIYKVNKVLFQQFEYVQKTVQTLHELQAKLKKYTMNKDLREFRSEVSPSSAGGSSNCGSCKSIKSQQILDRKLDIICNSPRISMPSNGGNYKKKKTNRNETSFFGRQQIEIPKTPQNNFIKREDTLTPDHNLRRQTL